NHTLSIAADLLNRHNGALIKTMGDGLMGTFPNPEMSVSAACQMQHAVSKDTFLSEHHISIKIGLNCGEVLLKDNDIFGDAVNIAARMVEIAKADQIITTRALAQNLPPILARNIRTLGQLRVKGKLEQMEIYEVLWRGKQPDLTIMASNLLTPVSETSLSVKLVLNYQGNSFQVADKNRPFLLGRNSDNDLVVNSAAVSRSHAAIECRQGKFILIDRSTNGAYVRLESGETFFIHREEIHLHGQGVISLGKDFSKEDRFFIYFECKS
ncbi:MAG: adenylate/guanylate cyclase domain-containing protein, partial [candidate division Zixibacteria bacterium]|nr:adenylate/guanylate cyclase domain-containing protein [candidate division Zixibacteria bacterium]